MLTPVLLTGTFEKLHTEIELQELYIMAFMQKQITDKRTWLEIDGDMGITFFDAADVDRDLLKTASANKAELLENDREALEEDERELASEYYDGEVYSVELRVGYGARLSAPGYMDCTDWTVYDTQEDAEKGLEADYGDDEESDED